MWGKSLRWTGMLKACPKQHLAVWFCEKRKSLAKWLQWNLKMHQLSASRGKEKTSSSFPNASTRQRQLHYPSELKKCWEHLYLQKILCQVIDSSCNVWVVNADEKIHSYDMIYDMIWYDIWCMGYDMMCVSVCFIRWTPYTILQTSLQCCDGYIPSIKFFQWHEG